jgi:hypothetical protein
MECMKLRYGGIEKDPNPEAETQTLHIGSSQIEGTTNLIDSEEIFR